MEIKKAGLNVPKKKDKTSWYQSRGFKSVLRVEATPGSTLANRVRERLQKENMGENMRILVVEKPSTSLQDLVSNYCDPWP